MSALKVSKNGIEKESNFGLKLRKMLIYIALGVITFFCLCWFYILFVNATRSHSQIQLGFSPVPGSSTAANWNNLLHGTLPIWNGLFNSLFVALASAACATYFSTMTAYAIHAYDFRLKKYVFTFILMV